MPQGNERRDSRPPKFCLSPCAPFACSHIRFALPLASLLAEPCSPIRSPDRIREGGPLWTLVSAQSPPRQRLRRRKSSAKNFAISIGIDTLGAVSSNGPQAFTWLLISAVIFLIPYGLLASELGSTFTQEGGVYEWCKLAFGRPFAAMGAMLYWVSNPLWVGGTLSVTAIAAIKVFWFGDPNYLFGGSNVANAIVEILIALIFIWGTTWCAIMSLRFGKWLSVFGSYVKLALFSIFVILALVFFFGGHATGQHIRLSDLLPHDAGLIVSAILPVIIFNW